MTTDIALWVAGILLVPAILWAIHCTVTMNKVKKDVSSLVKMHRGTNENLKENTRAIRSLTHYIKWFVTHQSGAEPPPPLEGGATAVGSD
ncbi:hypothetical protein LCGC14_2950510 [marine sediment metagenome]|uniref:Uncharacterized protein n=1 Tax=marine sediment metagenome TaxID=412755 RepID=A0A0F8Y2K9_9ZZZZ